MRFDSIREERIELLWRYIGISNEENKNLFLASLEGKYLRYRALPCEN